MNVSFQCRSCGGTHGALVLDLGVQPLANNLLRPEDLARPEPKFPLRLAVCQSCWLLQILDLVPPGAIVFRIPLFLIVLRPDAAPRQRRRRKNISRNSAWARKATSWKSPATTVICCKILWRQKSPASALNRLPTSPRWRGKKGSRPWWNFSPSPSRGGSPRKTGRRI